MVNVLYFLHHFHADYTISRSLGGGGGGGEGWQDIFIWWIVSLRKSSKPNFNPWYYGFVRFLSFQHFKLKSVGEFIHKLSANGHWSDMFLFYPANPILKF